jgi:pimeloyl-ACP methyl ester carboxylesterase
MAASIDEIERARLPGSFVRLSEGFVHYELTGPTDGPVVVLVPGLSVPFTIWDRNAPLLAESGFRVLRFDFYGRGFSDRPRVRYDLSLFVGQVEEIIKALRLSTPVSLVGLSMGGPIAAAAALKPGLAHAIALIDPLFAWRAPSGAAALLKFPVIGDAIMASAGRQLLVNSQRTDFFDEKEFLKFRPLYLPQLAYRGFSRSILSSVRSMPSWPLHEIYTKLGHRNTRAILFWGKEDATVPFEDSTRLLRLLQGARFHAVNNAGHLPHWEKPEFVNAALLDFLRCRIKY